ncbi:hypothetical protein VP01_59g2 [Puccinia sorghi]|uniref:Uncharacterized protein n=1 Tax=Puccinia sorghi TaxID=27349 RepID=A0A0L6UJJ7_9BASI|nr:hypothetical protein VP01_59g2 [Puccinia sorghi]
MIITFGDNFSQPTLNQFHFFFFLADSSSSVEPAFLKKANTEQNFGYYAMISWFFPFSFLFFFFCFFLLLCFTVSFCLFFITNKGLNMMVCIINIAGKDIQLFYGEMWFTVFNELLVFPGSNCLKLDFLNSIIHGLHILPNLSYNLELDSKYHIPHLRMIEELSCAVLSNLLGHIPPIEYDQRTWLWNWEGLDHFEVIQTLYQPCLKTPILKINLKIILSMLLKFQLFPLESCTLHIKLSMPNWPWSLIILSQLNNLAQCGCSCFLVLKSCLLFFIIWPTIFNYIFSLVTSSNHQFSTLFFQQTDSSKVSTQGSQQLIYLILSMKANNVLRITNEFFFQYHYTFLGLNYIIWLNIILSIYFLHYLIRISPSKFSFWGEENSSKMERSPWFNSTSLTQMARNTGGDSFNCQRKTNELHQPSYLLNKTEFSFKATKKRGEEYKNKAAQKDLISILKEKILAKQIMAKHAIMRKDTLLMEFFSFKYYEERKAEISIKMFLLSESFKVSSRRLRRTHFQDKLFPDFGSWGPAFFPSKLLQGTKVQVQERRQKTFLMVSANSFLSACMHLHPAFILKPLTSTTGTILSFNTAETREPAETRVGFVQDPIQSHPAHETQLSNFFFQVVLTLCILGKLKKQNKNLVWPVISFSSMEDEPILLLLSHTHCLSLNLPRLMSPGPINDHQITRIQFSSLMSPAIRCLLISW